MFKKKSSTILLYATGVTMVGAITYASIPGNLSPVPAIASSSATAPKQLKIAQAAPVTFNTIPVDVQAAPAETSHVAAPRLQPVVYTPETASTAGGGVVPIGGPEAPIAGAPVVTPLTGDVAEVDCRVDRYGHKVALPLEKLVEVIQGAINAAGPNPSVDSIRMAVQADLNRSGDFAGVKTEALHRLQASYRTDSATGQALSKPFDLTDDGMVYANGYDPCGNPAAAGGGAAFGTGPFSNVFFTINPVPVVAAKSTATTEGGPPV